MMRISIVALGVLAASCGSAGAQLLLPGSPAATTPPAAAAPPAADAPGARSPDKPAASFAAPVSAVAGRPLQLNGNQGQLLLSSHGKTLRIDKLSLAGEVISDPSRKCLIDIVGEAPIETKSLGKPDGLARFEAQIPACPFTFDVLDGAVLAPMQDRACVFQAADCQASPGGLWGPGADALRNDAKAIERRRSRAEAAAARGLKTLRAKLKGGPEADAAARDESDSAARREEVCRDYDQESVHAFCASRLAEAHAARIKARVDALQRRSDAQD